MDHWLGTRDHSRALHHSWHAEGRDPDQDGTTETGLSEMAVPNSCTEHRQQPSRPESPRCLDGAFRKDNSGVLSLSQSYYVKVFIEERKGIVYRVTSVQHSTVNALFQFQA